MALSFEFDISGLADLIAKSPEIAAEAARAGMHDVLNVWKAEAVDVAPIDEGILRKTITVEQIEGTGANLTGSISANAVVNTRSGRFNYAYYIHEEDAGGKNLRTPGTVKQFLDEPAKKNERKWHQHIEDEIESGLERAGW
ncbi:hypothetical protein DFP94_101545 [Fontibacillus phaseoli]|uniref:HK97 gp10 family phage protein n=1 Tax=Fontibacillus phaseoli TaxID=1416533 RepID=A0A369BQT1_9BACL|nr:HK97 gp10 family phage protein [Fontibacillus phaseoli]RCX22956.1 hypothetical protein DFP94_101545 [Fontibacillus phaseoli]